MAKDYVEHRDGSLYVAGTRVPLAQLAYEFQQGESPEAIRSHYPVLTLEEVYGSIAYYLSNREEVELDLAERRRLFDEFAATHPVPVELKKKLERARQNR